MLVIQIILFVLILVICFDKYVGEKKPSVREQPKDYKKFNLKEELYSLSYLTTIVSNEYFDKHILNHFPSRSGHERILIPEDHERQDHVDKIMVMVMEMVSVEHKVYLEKYISSDKLDLIVRSFAKYNYEISITQAMKIRDDEKESEKNALKRRNEHRSKIPKHIENILDYYDIDEKQAKEFVKGVKTDEQTYSKLKNGDPEKELVEHARALKGHFNINRLMNR